MVATRGHPKDFPSPTAEPSPTKRSTRSSGGTPSSPSPETSRAVSRSTAKAAESKGQWTHTPSNLTLGWLAISLPLVIWDTGYVLLRPYSMPGGFLHEPIWSPYKLYGEIDHTYGWKAYNSGNGWTAAQGSVNAIETLAYLVYLYLVYQHGVTDTARGRGAPEGLGKLTQSRTLSGSVAAGAVLIAYTAAQVTFWKTVLYWLIELFSGFDNVGHNTPVDLFFLFIVPNGAWLILPAYMCYVYGAEILQGLAIATGDNKKSK